MNIFKHSDRYKELSGELQQSLYPDYPAVIILSHSPITLLLLPKYLKVYPISNVIFAHHTAACTFLKISVSH
jgi:hypothetical protein